MYIYASSVSSQHSRKPEAAGGGVLAHVLVMSAQLGRRTTPPASIGGHRGSTVTLSLVWADEQTAHIARDSTVPSPVAKGARLLE